MAIHLPKGFQLAGVNCGIKKNPAKNDISLIVADQGCVAAGVYTTNRVVAAPVLWDKAITPSANIRAVITNSGNANACTGDQGVKDNQTMAEITAAQLNCQPDQVLVMSTGIIGQHLPMEKISTGIRAAVSELGKSEEHFLAAAKGILTTDKSEKVGSTQLQLDDQSFQLVGIAKGAGMIGPKMATMLSVLMTDLPLNTDQTQSILSKVVKKTFNRIRVEGHMSTNDTVLLLSTGSETESSLSEQDLSKIEQQIEQFCVDLAKQIPADGEGASHLLVIDVEGCANESDAEKIGQAVADSPLVKTAIQGGDPNWGRIVSAAGYAEVNFAAEKLELLVNGHLLYKLGTPVDFDEPKVSKSIKDQFETHILLRLEEGDAKARFWASDLTVEYVRFNAEYHT